MGVIKMYLGIDIGTTSVCAVVLDENGKNLYTATRANTFGRVNQSERTQDADGIVGLCKEIYCEAARKFNIKSLGVSGQMHGIIYVDEEGRAVSPLYSWQDERGNLPYLDGTYASVLSQKTGHKMATGFGSTSLFYDTVCKKIPHDAKKIVSVGDYVAMSIAKVKEPLVHTTVAASFGLFDVEKLEWDKAAIEKAGLSCSFFPKTTTDLSLLGKTAEGVSVYTAIGDNQASVYGAVKDNASFLVNVGTGSQISLITDKYVSVENGEIRPYLNGLYLLAGCPLCGGYSYNLLKKFFESVSGGPVDYSTMNAWAEEALEEGDAPTVVTQFKGTRKDPSARAFISGLSESNFNAKSLALGVLSGISRELYEFYDGFSVLVGKRTGLVGAGNAIRLNRVLRRVIENDYGLHLNIPAHKEEAAFGAALAAAEVKEGKSLKHFIKYE